MIEAHLWRLNGWTSEQCDSSTVAKRRKASCSGNVEEVQTPRIVDKYNQYMGGVDKGDQLASY